MTKTFEMNGRAYRTDAETLRVLRDQVQRFKTTDNPSVVIAILYLGMKAGVIVEEGAA